MAGEFGKLGVLESEHFLCLCSLPQATCGREGDSIYVCLSCSVRNVELEYP